MLYNHHIIVTNGKNSLPWCCITLSFLWKFKCQLRLLGYWVLWLISIRFQVPTAMVRTMPLFHHFDYWQHRIYAGATGICPRPELFWLFPHLLSLHLQRAYFPKVRCMVQWSPSGSVLLKLITPKGTSRKLCRPSKENLQMKDIFNFFIFVIQFPSMQVLNLCVFLRRF